MNESFTRDLRQAHRLVAGYERRVLDAVAHVGDQLAERALEFRRWAPQYHQATPDGRNSGWARRWIWDYLPLNCLAGYWVRGAGERAPGSLHVVVEHIIDTGIERWRADGKSGEPDALKFTDPSETLWRARVLWNPPTGPTIPEKVWGANWCDLFAGICGDAQGRYPKEGVVRGERDGLMAVQLCVSVDDLATAEDFTTKFVNPLLAEIDEIRI